ELAHPESDLLAQARGQPAASERPEEREVAAERRARVRHQQHHGGDPADPPLQPLEELLRDADCLGGVQWAYRSAHIAWGARLGPCARDLTPVCPANARAGCRTGHWRRVHFCNGPGRNANTLFW